MYNLGFYDKALQRQAHDFSNEVITKALPHMLREKIVNQPPIRLDGWKMIAAHFRRDRTTVMRWAQTRGLPIKRVPGGGSGSVYAYVHELDTWISQGGT